MTDAEGHTELVDLEVVRRGERHHGMQRKLLFVTLFDNLHYLLYKLTFYIWDY